MGGGGGQNYMGGGGGGQNYMGREEEEEGTIVYSVIHSTLYIWFILIHMKSNYKLEHKNYIFV